MTDPIADMLTRIRNAQMANKSEVVIPFSKIKMQIAEILKKEGYIADCQKEENQFLDIKITLKYVNNKPAIRSLKRVSKVGNRVYSGKDKLPFVLNNLGVSVVSTSKGLMTNKDARKQGVGGEIICEIY